MSNYTIQLFRYFYQNIPPLFPTAEKDKIRKTLQELESNKILTTDQIEDKMVLFGYILWPWNQAYKEFLIAIENFYGEEFLLPHLPKKIQEKYLNYKDYGLTLRDLYLGRSAIFFETEERVKIYRALLKMQEDLKKFTNQQIVSTEKKEFLDKVEKYKNTLEQIKEKIEELKVIALREQDHFILSNEIQEQIKIFEYGMCLLGPELDFQTITQSIDFFIGRRIDLNRMRGIETAKEIDFYSEE